MDMTVFFCTGDGEKMVFFYLFKSLLFLRLSFPCSWHVPDRTHPCSRRLIPRFKRDAMRGIKKKIKSGLTTCAKLTVLVGHTHLLVQFWRWVFLSRCSVLVLISQKCLFVAEEKPAGLQHEKRGGGGGGGGGDQDGGGGDGGGEASADRAVAAAKAEASAASGAAAATAAAAAASAAAFLLLLVGVR